MYRLRLLSSCRAPLIRRISIIAAHVFLEGAHGGENDTQGVGGACMYVYIYVC